MYLTFWAYKKFLCVVFYYAGMIQYLLPAVLFFVRLPGRIYHKRSSLLNVVSMISYAVSRQDLPYLVYILYLGQQA